MDQQLIAGNPAGFVLLAYDLSTKDNSCCCAEKRGWAHGHSSERSISIAVFHTSTDLPHSLNFSHNHESVFRLSGSRVRITQASNIAWPFTSAGAVTSVEPHLETRRQPGQNYHRPRRPGRQNAYTSSATYEPSTSQNRGHRIQEHPYIIQSSPFRQRHTLA
jgi:adenosylmethionine-8-amino-7-oxononanoate aminotransferase